MLSETQRLRIKNIFVQALFLTRTGKIAVKIAVYEKSSCVRVWDFQSSMVN